MTKNLKQTFTSDELKSKLKSALKAVNCQLEKDLNFSVAFHNVYNGRTNKETYNVLKRFGFKAFLTEFHLPRNLYGNEEKRIEVIRLLIEGIKKGEGIITIAETIRDNEMNLTIRKALPFSMVSKVYFLYNPHTYIPYDDYVFTALEFLGYDIERRNYGKYKEAIESFKRQNPELTGEVNKVNLEEEYEESIKYIESSLNKKIDIKELFLNRIIDKLLWIIGRDLKETIQEAQ